MAKEAGQGQQWPGGPAARGEHEQGTAKSAGDAVHKAGEEVAQTVKRAAEATRAAATDQVEQQKAAASESLNAFAQAIHRASDELRQRDQTAVAHLVNEAAGGLESLSRSLSQQNLSDMVDSMREFGRRNPAALAGGAALAGLALGRLARSSRARADHDQQHATATRQGTSGHYGSGDGGEFPASRASTMPAPSVSQPGGATRPGTGSSTSGGSHG